ncbi:hypothetical protein GJ744_010822 [Endocarpon pusillum]|uniref:Uncharacterized protein n=1 Tax=Endocarpon pusillum TaxID=364733 RepID=A0A8H7E1N1_9EURO|nr:hypothetical protein GJ744_010822 [Endocarpon pusillum]
MPPSTTPHPYQPNVRRRGAGPGGEVDEAESEPSDAGSREVAELNRRYPALRRKVKVVQQGPSTPRPPADRMSRRHAFQPWSPQTGETVPRPPARGADHSPILRNDAPPFTRQAMPPTPTRPERPLRLTSPEPHPHPHPHPPPDRHQTAMRRHPYPEERLYEPANPQLRIVPEPPRVIVGLAPSPNAIRLPNTVASEAAAPQFAMGWARPQGYPLGTGLPAEYWAARALATTTAPPPPPAPALGRASERLRRRRG